MKSLPKDSKIIRPEQKNVILTVRELLFRLSYHLFGSLMPADDARVIIYDCNMIIIQATFDC